VQQQEEVSIGGPGFAIKNTDAVDRGLAVVGDHRRCLDGRLCTGGCGRPCFRTDCRVADEVVAIVMTCSSQAMQRREDRTPATELLVEPTKSEGIFELYRRNAETAEQRDKPQPTQTKWAIGSMEWLAEQKKSALNRSRSLAGRSGGPRQQSSQVTGAPMVRIHLPPGQSPQTTGSAGDFTRLIPIIQNHAGSIVKFLAGSLAFLVD
jgi:hypothetical protein